MASFRPESGKMPAISEAEGSLVRLKSILRAMFQLDRGDLDFGLYRIINMKARQIEAFLDRDLLPQVRDVLAGMSAERRRQLEKELSDTIEQLKSLKASTDDNQKVQELRLQLQECRQDADAESDVYAHLARFFSRYYDEGDFMQLRRYSRGGRPTYLLPYDGEDVRLHWANADQYYVKTSENYTSYAFVVGAGANAFRVRFGIMSASSDNNNCKQADDKRRRFVLAQDKQAIVIEGREITIRFEHRPLTDAEKRAWPASNSRQQEQANETAVAQILERLEKQKPEMVKHLMASAGGTAGDSSCSALARHLKLYTAKNSFDYFIHKDIGGFLRHELDLYIKQDVLKLDDLAMGDTGQLRRHLAHTQAVRCVAEKIIAFLAQLEDFQKRIWLRKKFVLETQWCMTLDMVPKGFYPEIAANQAQQEEWVQLFSVNEIVAGLDNGCVDYSNPPSSEFLEANPGLVLDTKNFDSGFKDRLLAALSNDGNLDQRIDGLLVHGENFQALNLIQPTHGGEIDCAYIDPPYNTGDSEIPYKNGYLRSSWLSLMSNSLSLMQDILSSDPVLYVAIDDFEMANLAKLLDTQCPWLRREMIVVNHHPQGGMARTLASTHEYMIVCIPKSSSRMLAGRLASNDSEARPFRRSGTAESNFRNNRPNSFYALLVDPASRKVVGLEAPPRGASYPLDPTSSGLARVYPISGKDERVWRKSYKSCRQLIEDGKLFCSNGSTIYQRIDPEERRPALFSNWTDRKYNAGTFGANLLRDIMGRNNPFSYPKSLHTVKDAIFAAGLGPEAWVLDYFAGSGTTGHAVIDMNRDERAKRRYILIEMADHFDTVLLPRIKKVTYSSKWKKGKPIGRGDHASQLVKCIRLESYEDALDGLELHSPADGLPLDNAAFAEDYQLHHALNVETANSPGMLSAELSDPDGYAIPVTRDGVRGNTPVDLPETFNYLIGLRVKERRRIDGVLAISGRTKTGQQCLVLWRNAVAMDNAAMEKWFAGNRSCLPDPLDLIYINGDHTLNATRQPKDTWTAMNTEPVFRQLMFCTKDRQ